MKIPVDVGRLLESLGIEARKRHDEWFALCPDPDHDDRRPTTWRIVDSGERAGLHHCWSCGYRGDAVTLTRDVLGVGYHAALSWIESEAAPPPEEFAGERWTVETVVPRVFRLPGGVEELPLERWPVVFRRYMERRGVPGWQVARWRLGFAIEGRLAGRVVLPVRAQSGKLLNYSARAIGASRTRYLTPARDDGPDPGAMFGEEHHGSGGRCVVLEGAFDALAVERAVWPIAVAVLGSGGGTARDQNVLTQGIRKLARFREVVIATDPNPAGESLAGLLLEAIGSRARRARPPEGFDAASMTADALRGIIKG